MVKVRELKEKFMEKDLSLIYKFMGPKEQIFNKHLIIIQPFLNIEIILILK